MNIKYKYTPNSIARKNPRFMEIVVNGKKKLVGIGGKIPVRGFPPIQKPAIDEATPDEYRVLREVYKMDGLVDKAEVRSVTRSPKKTAKEKK